MKSWLVERGKLFQMRASLTNDIVPKGVLIMGIPGCGKSLCVKAIARHFQLPLYRVDMIEIFSGRHGKPEGAFVAACRMMEDLAPAVLWFDEIEMGITSTESSGEQGRIFAFFLTWMQEKVRGLFVAATANRIDLLPAEMIRKGRFDEIFFCDLPDREDRRQILDIHLRKKKRDPGQFDMDRLIDATVDYSGAELEQAVIASLYDAFDTGNDLTTEGLVKTVSEIVPLAITMREMIEGMREWARTRARPASARSGKAPKKEGWMARYGAPTANLGDKGPGPGEDDRKIEL